MQDQATLQNKALKPAPKPKLPEKQPGNEPFAAGAAGATSPPPPGPPDPATYLRSKGWTEDTASGFAQRSWFDPECKTPGGRYYSLAEAVELQKLRDHAKI